MSCHAFVPALSIPLCREGVHFRSTFHRDYRQTTSIPAQFAFYASTSLDDNQQQQRKKQNELRRRQRPYENDSYRTDQLNKDDASFLTSSYSIERRFADAFHKKQTTRLPYLFKSLLLFFSNNSSTDTDADNVSISMNSTEKNEKRKQHPMQNLFYSTVKICISRKDTTSLSHILNICLENESSPILPYLQLSYLVPSLIYLTNESKFQTVYIFLNKLFEYSTVYNKIRPDLKFIVRISNVAVNLKSYKYSLKYMSLLKVNKIQLNVYAYSVLLKCYGRSKNIAGTHKIINILRKDNHLEIDNVVLNCMLDALIRCNEVRSAHQILLNVSYNQIIDVTSYNTVIKGMTNDGRIIDAFRLVNRMQSSNIKICPITINTLTTGCINAHDFHTARSMINSFYLGKTNNVIKLKAPTPPKPKTPPPELKKSLLSKLTLASNSGETDMDEVDHDTDHPNQDDRHEDEDNSVEPVITLDVSLSSSSPSLKNQVDENDADSSKTLETQEAENKYKNQFRIAMTTLLSGLAEDGRVLEALETLNEMCELGVEPNTITYASLITAFFNHGSLNEAMKLFDSINNDDLVILNAVVAGLCKQYDYKWIEEAGDIIENTIVKKHRDQYNERYLDKNKAAEVETLNLLLHGYVNFQKFDRAEYILHVMKKFNITPTAASYTTLIQGYTYAKRFGRAKKMFHDLIQHKYVEPDTVAMNAYIAACARSNDIGTAERVLAYMESHVKISDGAELNPSAQSYSPLLLAYAREFQNEQVWTLYERMRSVGGVPINDYVMQLLCEYIAKSVMKMKREDEEEEGEDDDDYDMTLDEYGDDDTYAESKSCRKRRRSRQTEELAKRSGELLRNGLDGSVSPKVLRIGKKKLMPLFSAQLRKRYFTGLDSVEFRSVSETIFERHGWNNIQSGWRFL